MKKKIYLVCGRSCSGKSSIVRQVCKNLGMKYLKSYTTRDARPGEEKESDHIFIRKEDAEWYKQQGIVAWTEINGNEYFATRELLDQSDFYVIDPAGIDYLRNTCWDEYDFIVIYIRVPYATAKKRSEHRGDKNFSARYESENSMFGEFERKGCWDYHLLNNGTLEDAVAKMKHIIEKENHHG